MYIKNYHLSIYMINIYNIFTVIVILSISSIKILFTVAGSSVFEFLFYS